MKFELKILSIVCASALVFSSSSLAWSQSDTRGFGSASVAVLQSRNSASSFSVANIQNSIRARSAATVGVPGVNQRNFLGNPGSLTRKSKPFSSVGSGPTVSPYLSLSNPLSTASDYYNIVRPQQQLERQNRQAQIQSIRQQRKLNQLAARAPFSTTGDENRAPTGHVAVFQSLGSYQNTGNYFPPPSRPKQR